MNLITGFEVVANSPASRQFPVDDVCKHIYRIETIQLKQCLGEDARAYLITKLTAVAGEPEEWVEGNTYDLDEVVIYFGRLYKSLAAANTALIKDTSKWEPVEKFNNALLNELWVNGLRDWIAYHVLAATVPYATYKIGSEGVAKNLDSRAGIMSAEKEEVWGVQRQLKKQAEEYQELALCYLNDRYDDRDGTEDIDWDKFSIFNESCASGNCSNTPGGRRVAW